MYDKTSKDIELFCCVEMPRSINEKIDMAIIKTTPKIKVKLPFFETNATKVTRLEIKSTYANIEVYITRTAPMLGNTMLDEVMHMDIKFVAKKIIDIRAISENNLQLKISLRLIG